MSNLPVQEPSTERSAARTRHRERDAAIDYLRAFLIVLVICLHAALAYTSFSTFNESRWVDSSAPVVDVSRWPVLDALALFLDTFLMPLLFLISGLFTMSSLERQGSGGFFRARLQRLGIPFVVAALLLSPLHFLPAYLMANPKPPSPYLSTFFTSDGWPVGTPWFLWVLLAFDGILAFTYWIAPHVVAKLHRQPTVLVVILVTIIAFVPLSLVGSHFWWVSLGPFDVQPIRGGLYFAFFLLGAALGTGQEWRRIGWPRKWGYCLALGVLSFFVYIVVMGGTIQLPSLVSWAIFGVAFAGSCAGTSLALLGAFRRLVRGNHPILDSLSANSYGIYIVHYAYVTWIQFALLPVSWPAWSKFGITFIGSLVLSWGTSQLARKIPAVRRVI